MLNQIIKSKTNLWLQSEDCTIKEIVKYIRDKGEMRDTQIEAIEKSEPLLSSILETDAANTVAHVLMARVMWGRQDEPGREQELRLALDSDPRNVEALLAMGRFIYFSGSNVNKGLEYIQEAERIDPYSIDVLWDLIAFNAFRLQPEKTEIYAERIAEIQPENPNR